MIWGLVALTVLAGAMRWRNKYVVSQALVICLGLLAMLPFQGGELSRLDWLMQFAIWIGVAYAVDAVGEDAAPGTLLAASALFYPAIAVGCNSWWCQLGANMFGLAALGVIGGIGGGLLADYRFGRTGVLGIFWRSHFGAIAPGSFGVTAAEAVTEKAGP